MALTERLRRPLFVCATACRVADVAGGWYTGRGQITMTRCPEDGFTSRWPRARSGSASSARETVLPLDLGPDPSAGHVTLRGMDEAREELLGRLETYYREGGWPVKRDEDLVLASGPGGVTWLGRAVVPEDLADDAWLEARLVELADRRMPVGNQLCPLELLPTPECKDGLQAVLDRSGLGSRGHVRVYSLTT